MRARKGASFLEYALLAALIGIVGAVGIMKYGQAISDFFSGLATWYGNASAGLAYNGGGVNVYRKSVLGGGAGDL